MIFLEFAHNNVEISPSAPGTGPPISIRENQPTCDSTLSERFDTVRGSFSMFLNVGEHNEQLAYQ